MASSTHVEIGDARLREGRIDIYRRVLDILFSAVLLLLALPVIALVSMGSAVSLRAWPYFSQYRVGRDGQLFRFIKVRTLPADHDAYTDKHHLEQDRIPSFCRVVRALHLDELPQLVLVLFGKMSLVGPRPEMEHLHGAMAPGFAELRTSVRPGCTGVWQVSESSVELIGAAPEYDRFYLANRTVRLDLWILFRTGLHMLGLGKPITLADVPEWTRRRSAGSAPVADPAISLPVTAGR